MEMLKTTPYKQITVSDLCEKMGIARKIFYKHYHDKRDCLCYLIDDALTEASAYTARNIEEWTFSLSSAMVDMEGWKKKKDFLAVIAENQLYDLLMERTLLLSLGEDMTTIRLLNRSDLPCDVDILIAFHSSYFALIFNWYSRGFDTSVEEMAKKFIRLSRYPMLGLSDLIPKEQA